MFTVTVERVNVADAKITISLAGCEMCFSVITGPQAVALLAARGL